MNLYQLINNMFKRENSWNYYSESMDIQMNGEMAKEFISQYFSHGAKQGAVLPLIDKLDIMRQTHTVSAYFIGVLIQKNYFLTCIY